MPTKSAPKKYAKALMDSAFLWVSDNALGTSRHQSALAGELKVK
jgi:hypothetical protein